MLISGEAVRLTKNEKTQLEGLTGSNPNRINSLETLRHFVNAHLVNYPGRSAEELLLRRMLESFLPA